MSNKKIHMLTFLLLVVGGLNWLLFGLFEWEIGEIFGGSDSVISRIIYILIGLAAVYELLTHKNNCKTCATPNGPGTASSPTSDFK
ncbi:DUF378 domain-containing protein [Patescibacteria group bacterium]|nr:DUF378 domain-containing protein [Patescibacteria group bacterium]